MSEPLPTFALFRDPVREKSFEVSTDVCEVCGRARGWRYVCNIYGEGDGEQCICPWCIADGSAAATFDCIFNVGDVYPLSAPQLTPEDRELVERRTPGFGTWQDHGWMMCCGRASVYVGEAEGAELTGRWASVVPMALKEWRFAESYSAAEKDELIAGIYKGGSPCVYVFECQVCRGLRCLTDAM